MIVISRFCSLFDLFSCFSFRSRTCRVQLNSWLGSMEPIPDVWFVYISEFESADKKRIKTNIENKEIA